VQLSEFFHLIHVVDQEDPVDAFYDELFAPQRFRTRHFSPHEMRWASLSMVSDLMLEVIEPSAEADHQGFPLPRFHKRFGQHFHSLAWYVEQDQVRPTFDALRAAGIRVAKPGGGIWPSDGDVEPGNTLFTHPKDTFGQLEFEGKFPHWQTADPRFQPGWSAAPWQDGPLGIRRLSHMTTVVRDLPPAVDLYERVLGGRVLHRESSGGADRAFVLLGIDTVIELAEPTVPGTRLVADLDANGELPHSATFRVADLARAEQHAEKLGIGIVDRSDEAFTLEPDDCYGAVWSFTERAIPGDPRPAEA
jgi:catechol 2,3-dioxygenase-like lactoylglutathione lyase family enzyme